VARQAGLGQPAPHHAQGPVLHRLGRLHLTSRSYNDPVWDTDGHAQRRLQREHEYEQCPVTGGDGGDLGHI
jgi:hypothetical protein